LLYFYFPRRVLVSVPTSNVSIPASGIVVFLPARAKIEEKGGIRFPSRRAGLLYFYSILQLVLLPRPLCFHPGERDCCISTRGMALGDQPSRAFPSRRAGLLYFYRTRTCARPFGNPEFPSRRAGLLYFYVKCSKSSYGITAQSFHPGERDCCISTIPSKLLSSAPPRCFHPGERDCCISTRSCFKHHGSTRIDGFHPGERDCCISTNKEIVEVV